MPLLLLFADLLTAPIALPPTLPPRPPVPPVEGRPRLVWPRGSAVPVRRAVCCFWPAIGERYMKCFVSRKMNWSLAIGFEGNWSDSEKEWCGAIRMLTRGRWLGVGWELSSMRGFRATDNSTAETRAGNTRYHSNAILLPKR